ncbi:hypothetical protein L2E82_48897 [Cichorium intybus]|uniref:Uncharacterized protein n=1 Tax=Cichorium intybus TaxID=13427 RepID=A0ACB8Z009_CICIN|nr:hypothetical protein L2E82_48897 [Cichorium intybus]
MGKREMQICYRCRIDGKTRNADLIWYGIRIVGACRSVVSIVGPLCRPEVRKTRSVGGGGWVRVQRSRREERAGRRSEIGEDKRESSGEKVDRRRREKRVAGRRSEKRRERAAGSLEAGGPEKEGGQEQVAFDRGGREQAAIMIICRLYLRKHMCCLWEQVAFDRGREQLAFEFID